MASVIRKSSNRAVVLCLVATWIVLTAPGLVGEGERQQEGVQSANDETRGDESGNSSHFGRMFHLPPFAPPTEVVAAALIKLGSRGGLLDAQDNLAAGPVNLIVDPSLSAGNPDNQTHTAGVTFLGQFLDHDMTFDTSSRLGRPRDPSTSPNARRPFFDLDSVYG